MKRWMEAIHLEEDRAMFERPVSAPVDGVPHTVAANHAVMVCVEGVSMDGAYEEASEREMTSLARILSDRATTLPLTLDLADLKRFLAVTDLADDAPCPTCAGEHVITCPSCLGSGVNDGDICSCPVCGRDHDAACDKCEGGKADCPDCRAMLPAERVQIGGGVFNARALRPVLARLRGDSVTWAQDRPEKMATVRGPGWWLLVMPMRRLDEEDRRTTPVRDYVPGQVAA